MRNRNDDNMIQGLRGVTQDGKEYAIMMEISGVESLDDYNEGPETFGGNKPDKDRN